MKDGVMEKALPAVAVPEFGAVTGLASVTPDRT
jgi:hypothetical protein